VSIRQHASAYVSIRQHACELTLAPPNASCMSAYLGTCEATGS
jgi:hypothetical protein